MKNESIFRGDFFRVLVSLFIGALIACPSSFAAGGDQAVPDWGEDRAEFIGFEDPARALLQSPRFQALLNAPDAQFVKSLDEVFSLEYDIPVGQGRRLHVTERFTLRSILRFPRRAVVFLGGHQTNAEWWNLPGETYNGAEMAARRGMFAFTVDFLGIGESFLPEDGSEVRFEDNVRPIGKLVKFIRAFRQVFKVDLVGEGIGANIASQVAADDKRVRSCVMSTTLYMDFALAHLLLTPQFEAYLSSLENGYWTTTSADYANLVFFSPPEISAFTNDTQPGAYPTGPFWALFEGPPYFDPTVARVPGLVIAGQFDPVPGPTDAADLARDYGTDGAELVVLNGGGHVPRVESPAVAAAYWTTVFDFIDP